MQRQEDVKNENHCSRSCSLFAIAPRAHAQNLNRAGWRGTVEVTGRAVKVVTTGPALLHGYSEFSGGAIFVAPVATGTDADCVTALANGDAGAKPLVADRVAYVPVGAGQVACLVTTRSAPSSCSGTPSRSTARRFTWPARRRTSRPASQEPR